MVANYDTKLSKEIFGTEEVYQPESKNVSTLSCWGLWLWLSQVRLAIRGLGWDELTFTELLLAAGVAVEFAGDSVWPLPWFGAVPRCSRDSISFLQKGT